MKERSQGRAHPYMDVHIAPCPFPSLRSCLLSSACERPRGEDRGAAASVTVLYASDTLQPPNCLNTAGYKTGFHQCLGDCGWDLSLHQVEALLLQSSQSDTSGD